jgi:surface protein
MSALGANAAEAYACYTPDNTTLTFYHDNYRSSRMKTGTTYDLNTGNDTPIWCTDGTMGNVTKVVFSPSFADARPTSTFAWFYEMVYLESIEGLSYLNTSKVTTMGWMFAYCLRLTNIDLSDFNTSLVTQMYYMFVQCISLRAICVGDGWTTSAVTNSMSMFDQCISLEGGKGTTWNESNPNDKTYAHIDGGSSDPGYFKRPEAYACYTPGNTALTFYYDGMRKSHTRTYDLNTDLVEPGWCSNGTNAKVTKVVFHSSFARVRPTTTFDWFYGMTNLESIEGMKYLNTSKVENMNWMFADCSKLTSLDLRNFDTSNVHKMARMFSGCSSLTTLDLASFNTSLVDEMGNMFYECSSLQTIYVGSDWNLERVLSHGGMFYHCTNLVGGQGTTYSFSHTDKTYAHIDGGARNPGYFTVPPEAYACYTSSNSTLTFYFDDLRSTRSGTTYDLNWLTNLPDWLGINTSVTKVVFDPSFAGARPTTTAAWFINMENLESIEGMSYLNTSEATYMSFMFLNCSCLTSLDLSSFNTSQVDDMYYMFSGCTSLQTIYVWTTSAVTNSDSMFDQCISLVGSKGTTYDANHIEKEYAHIDGGKSNPGYFTYRNTGITTNIENGQRDAVKVQRDEWFTIDGQKLSGKPTKRGVYIVNGRAVVR